MNAASLEKDLLARYARPRPRPSSSRPSGKRILEDEDFFDIKISVKHSNPMVMIEAYRQLAERCDYPLHLGVTEAGPMPMGGVKSAVGSGLSPRDRRHDPRLADRRPCGGGQGRDGDPAVAGPAEARPRSRRCPSCGRAEVDVLGLTKQVNEALEREGLKVPIRVAVMGCVVNGPGEAREADLGIAAGKGQGFLVVKGEVVDKMPETDFVTRLVAEAKKIAAATSVGSD